MPIPASPEMSDTDVSLMGFRCIHAHGAQSVRRISADDQARAGAPGVPVCLTRLFGRSDSSPEQENQKDDQQDQAEATAIVMVWGSIIEAAAAKQKN